MRPWLALILAGCTLAGERSQTGNCPPGETCSDKTPNGLALLGTKLGDNPLGPMQPLATAVAGTQQLTVVTGATGGAPAFTLPFDATTTSPSLAVTDVAPPKLTVEGLAAGTSDLRLVEPGTQLLYDRLPLAVAAVATVDLRPLVYSVATSDADFAANSGAGWAMLAGGTDDLLVRLGAGDGTRIVDQRMTIAATGSAFASGQMLAWDTLRVRAVGAGEGTLVVRTGDGTTHPQTVPLAAAVDDVLWVSALGAVAPNGTAVVGAAPIYCFRAVSGTSLVAGATWSYTATFGLTLTASVAKNCVVVTAGAGASGGALTVTASGVSRDFTVAFVG